MLKAIVSFSLRFRGVIIALACLAFFYGIFVTWNAKLGVFPDFAPPQVVVQTEALGLSSGQVEALVTHPIENALMGITDLDTIRSKSIQGLSVVTVTFRGGTNVYRARQLVGERLLVAANQMPRGVSAPVMAPLTSATSTILEIGLTSKRLAPMDLWAFAYWTLRPSLLAVPGVAKTTIFGGGVRQLQIQVRPKRLLAYKLGISDVLRAAREATGVRGAGFVENANQRIVLRARGQALTPAQFGNTVVRHVDGRSVLLKNVATVKWAPRPLIGAAEIMGRPGVIIRVSSQYGANTLEVTRGIDRALRGLGPTLAAKGIKLDPKLFSAATFIDTAVRNMRSSLLLGGLLVAVVLSLFLFNIRTAFISLTAIPLSLLSAIVILQRMGVTLNTITLGGLAIAIGEVVDDAIIDVENIFRRLRENRASAAPRPIFDVILDASLEVRSAVVYATFVVALVFLPVLAMSGVQGRIFAPLGEAYVLAIMASLAVALTLTPALCYMLLPQERSTGDTAFIRWLKRAHRRLLESLANRQIPVMSAIALLCIGTIATLPFLSGSFLPQLHERSFVLHMSAIPGTSMTESIRTGRLVTRALLKNPKIEKVSQRVGRAVLGDDTHGPQSSEFSVVLKRGAGIDLGRVQDQLRRVLAQFPGWGFSMNSVLTERIQETLSGDVGDVVIKIFGNNLDVLDSEGKRVAAVLSRIRGAVDVHIQSPGGMPQMVVRLRRSRLDRFGFTPVEVLDALRTAYEGSVVAQTYQGDEVFGVSVILEPSDRRSPESVGSLMLRSPDGDLIPLRELASIHLARGHYAVLHDGGRRVQVVTCNVRGRALDSFVAEARRDIRREVPTPAGTYVEFAGSATARAQAMHDIMLNSLVAAVAIIALLYIAFGSARNLSLVLVNVPFALVGGVLAALITGGYLSLGSIVGFVTLFGITMRNSIMMISHFDHLVSVEGMEWGLDAALRGASERLVPILMTALVTALGVLPLAMGSGAPGREIEGPMAIIILGGLLTSTALNLIVLPTLALRWGRFGAET